MGRHLKNLIILHSDEMRGDAPGFMGNPDCKTPCLDRFAEEGIVFNRHFSVFPKCVPSRCSMMTGRYAHSDGTRTVNETDLLPEDRPNLLSALKAAGYETAVFGLNHCWENFCGEENKKATGIVDYQSFEPESFEPINLKKLSVSQPGPDSLPVYQNEKAINLQVTRITEPLPYHSDDHRTEQAVHYLKNVRDRSMPFFMQLNLSAPHPPYKVEEPWFSMYDRDQITPYPYALPDNAPLCLQKMREIRAGGYAKEKDFRQVQAVYYGMISKVDSLLGSVLDAIREEGLWEDSIVIFTSDHGDFAGQYGLPEKWDTSMADCLLRVPFVLCAHGLPSGIRVDSLTEHIDVPSTVLELFGIEPDWDMHGESLLQAINGKSQKEAVFADGGHEASMRARFNTPLTVERDGIEVPMTQGKQETYFRFPDTMARTRMVRTQDWKLVMRETDDHELYDLRHDPDELSNVWKNPPDDAPVKELMEKLIRWSIHTAPEGRFQPRVGA